MAHLSLLGLEDLDDALDDVVRALVAVAAPVQELCR